MPKPKKKLPPRRKPKKRGPKASKKGKSAVSAPQKDWHAAFLECLCETGNVSAAARAARVDRQTAYNHRETDETFAKAWDDALEVATDVLETEARRRAVEGVDEPVGWFQGQPGGYVKRYSDTLLIFLLKGNRPNKYRERFEHTGAGGTPLSSGVTVYLPSNGRGDGDGTKQD